jgi:hypothetical protein
MNSVPVTESEDKNSVARKNRWRPRGLNDQLSNYTLQRLAVFFGRLVRSRRKLTVCVTTKPTENSSATETQIELWKGNFVSGR